MLTPTQARKGQLYVVQIVGTRSRAVAECVVEADPEPGASRANRGAWLRVLNHGAWHDAVLKDGDYLIEEAYDPERHGPIEGPTP